MINRTTEAFYHGYYLYISEIKSRHSYFYYDHPVYYSIIKSVRSGVEYGI